jgi:hypothetical protein
LDAPASQKSGFAGYPPGSPRRVVGKHPWRLRRAMAYRHAGDYQPPAVPNRQRILLFIRQQVMSHVVTGLLYASWRISHRLRNLRDRGAHLGYYASLTAAWASSTNSAISGVRRVATHASRTSLGGMSVIGVQVTSERW